ncbi:MAG TPA: hypothetical protein VK496_05330 [Gaiellaceae bacterium]|nr:hypothetical protein [Gaiellaceae bacterium]
MQLERRRLLPSAEAETARPPRGLRRSPTSPRALTSTSISSVYGKIVTDHLPALRTTVEEELETPRA